MRLRHPSRLDASKAQQHEQVRCIVLSLIVVLQQRHKERRILPLHRFLCDALFIDCLKNTIGALEQLDDRDMTDPASQRFASTDQALAVVGKVEAANIRGLRPKG